MADKDKKTEEQPSFEKDLERLEALVDTLEEGGLPLDESIKRFEEGITLWKRCEQALTHAEKRIEVLTKKADGALQAEPFDADESDTPPAKAAKRTAKAAPKASGPVDVPDDESGGDDTDDDDEDEMLF